MPERQHYEHAPIVEALIDIQVAPPTEPMERLTELFALLKDQYPEKQDIFEENLKFQDIMRDISRVERVRRMVGLRLTNPETNRVIILRQSGFTYSVLSPYGYWEQLRDAAREAWNHYRLIGQVQNVTRIAVRYINRLDLPPSLQDLQEYVQILPSLPPKLPGERPGGYFMQLQIPQSDLQSMLIINTGLISPPPDKPDAISIALDFDLFRDLKEAPWSVAEDIPMWDFLEQLHDRKNAIFEASITDKTRELIR